MEDWAGKEARDAASRGADFDLRRVRTRDPVRLLLAAAGSIAFPEGPAPRVDLDAAQPMPGVRPPPQRRARGGELAPDPLRLDLAHPLPSPDLPAAVGK